MNRLQVVFLDLPRVRFFAGGVKHREVEMGVRVFGIDFDGGFEGFLGAFREAFLG